MNIENLNLSIGFHLIIKRSMFKEVRFIIINNDNDFCSRRVLASGPKPEEAS